MATDATGTATSLGIPKINPDADAPSGAAMNEQADAIDALLKTLGIASLVAHDVPIWDSVSSKFIKATGTPSASVFLRGDGSWQAVGTKTTTSTMAGGPPGTPADGDVWIATAVDANGTRWAFQYNGSGSTYKWEFIGGSPMYSEVATAEATSSAAYAALTTPGPAIALPRAGDYMVGLGSYANCNNSIVFMSYDIGGTGAVDADGVSISDGALIIEASLSRLRLKTALTAVTLTAKYKTTAATITFKNRFMSVTPVRIA